MSPGKSELEAWLAQQARACRLCPRSCGADRPAGQTGWCGAGHEARWYRAFVPHGEEPELAPSLTLYLTGCNLAGRFCHPAPERRGTRGRRLTATALRRIAGKGLREGARNLNLLGGEPMVNLPGVLPLLADPTVRRGLPLVWNTNLYCTAEALAHLQGLPDVYLVDLKFGPGPCAGVVAAAEDYWPVVTARLLELQRREPARIMLRHLVLPGHFDCCTRPALEWAAAHLPGVPLNVMTEYLVMPAARACGDLGRYLTPEEAAAATELALRLGYRPSRRVPPPVACSAPTSGTAAVGDDGVVELVLAPTGSVLLRHPTRAALALVRRASQTALPQGEESP